MIATIKTKRDHGLRMCKPAVEEAKLNWTRGSLKYSARTKWSPMDAGIGTELNLEGVGQQCSTVGGSVYGFHNLNVS
jgi:hypothetical protein